MAKVSNVIVRITKSLNKKGKIVGKNKKETKALKGSCVHHIYNKHGKEKARTFGSDGGESLTCSVCKAQFPTKFYTNDEMDEIVDAMIEFNNQNKFMAVATNAGNETIEYYSQMGAMLAFYKKNSKKLRNIAEKQGTVKSKKKHNRGGGSSMYGSWGQR